MSRAFRRLLIALAASLPALSAAATAVAGMLTAEYTVSIRGLPVGHAVLQAQIADGRYTFQFTGRLIGVARLFSDIQTSAVVDGVLDGDQFRPDDYRHLWRENDDTETVSMRFADRRLADVAVEPPVKHPERYVPLKDADKLDVLDPVTAFVWPAAEGVTPAICDRTLPLMDGRRRFDIALSFKRETTFVTRDDSRPRPAVVCGFRYRTLAGNRIDKKKEDTIINSDGMEVWMAPAGDGLAAPARIQVTTRFGRVVFQATRLAAN